MHATIMNKMKFNAKIFEIEMHYKDRFVSII